jgi:hypothetical protein
MTQIIINETTPIIVEVSTPGPQGSSGTVAVGTVTTGASGSAAEVTNSGTPSAAVFNFTIPKGDIGDVTPAATAAKNAAEAAATAAQASSTAAQSSSTSASASATAALNSANQASASASTASTKAQEATTSANNASNSAQSVLAAANTATTKAQEAATSASNALASANTASTKAQEASASEVISTTKAQEAVVSATTATNAATSASASAASALASKQVTTDNAALAIAQATISSAKATQAAASEAEALAQAGVATNQAAISTAQAVISSNQASIATTQAAAAVVSAQSAATSASTATTQAGISTAQATTATNKAAEAATSASASASSAAAALTSQTSASGSATAANTSAVNAANSASTATTQANTATAQAVTATTQATTATAQATAASSSAATASTQAATATAQATIATTQATAASASASNAALSATAAANAQTAAAASTTTATTQAAAATAAKTAAETARDAAIVAQNNAVAVVTGGTATLTPQAGKIPLADGLGKIAKGWLTNTDLVEQTDIGTAPNEIPLNQYLGEMAYMDADKIPTIGVATANLATANVTNLMQVTEVSTVMPTLNLDFAKVKQLDPRITFTRASTGTYYDGKTRAKAEENLWVQSQNVESWANLNINTITNAVIAPDGTLTADKIVATAVSGTHYTNRPFTKIPNIPYAFSIYVKAAEYSYVRFVDGWWGAYAAVFDLTGSGSVTSGANCTPAIESLPNGWFRVSVVFNNIRAEVSPSVIGVPTSSSNENYAGDGTSGVFIWGAQLEQRSAATAYTPTTTQPITNYIPQLMTAASGVPRFEHDPVTGESLGLEIEEQRTNLLLRSAEFDSGNWAKVNVTTTANTVVSPDGTVNADTVNAATGPTAYITQSVTGVSGTVYTWSVWLRGIVGGEKVRLLLDGGLGTQQSDLITLTKTWARYTLTSTSPSSAIGYAYILSGTTYGGTGQAYYIWGAQLEAGAFATSYIPTTTAQVTRAADSASMTGANFSSWYRQDEGTVYIENNYNFGSDLNSGSRVALQIDNGSASDRFILSNSGFANAFVAQVGGVTQAFFNGATNTANFVKTAFGYATNNMAISTSGSLPSTDTSCLVPLVNTMRIGMFSNNALQLSGNIRKITYYPQRLSNAELVEITA